MKVYLAGGMRSGWQEIVKQQMPHLDFFDPRDKELDDTWNLDKFGSWDLAHIRRCDVVFAYMEKTNPSGVGMACEMGYAYGLGKTVILCLELDNEHQKDRYLGFMRKVSQIVFDNFEEALDYLKTFK